MGFFENEMKKLNDDNGNKFNHKRFMPWYSDRADYNTNSKGYYDFLGRVNNYLSILEPIVNKISKRNIKFNETNTITPDVNGVWDNGDDVLEVNNNVKISQNSYPDPITGVNYKNSIVEKTDGIYARDTSTALDDTNDEFAKRGINVKWYGAVGDGVSDDTASFKKAIDNARDNFLNKTDHSNVIIIPKGDYLITKEIILPPYVKLVSSGNVRLFINNVNACIHIDYYPDDKNNDYIVNYFKQNYTRGDIISGSNGGIRLIYTGNTDVVGTISTGLKIGTNDTTQTNANLPISRFTISQLFVTGFNYGIQITGINTYLISFYGLHAEFNKNNILLGGYSNRNAVNSGENISFYGSIITSATNNFVFNINSFDINLYGTSVNYSKVAFKFKRAGNNVNVIGGHLEDNVVYVDNTEVIDTTIDMYSNINFIDTKLYIYGEINKLFISNQTGIKSLIELHNVHFLGGYLTDVDYLSDNGFIFLSNYINTGAHRLTPISSTLNPIIDYDYKNETMTMFDSGKGEKVGYTTNVPNSRYDKAIELVGVDDHTNYMNFRTKQYIVGGKKEMFYKVPYYTQSTSSFTNMEVMIHFLDVDGNEILETQGTSLSPGTGKLDTWIFRYGIIRDIPLNAYKFYVKVGIGSAFKNSRKLVGPLNFNIL